MTRISPPIIALLVAVILGFLTVADCSAFVFGPSPPSLFSPTSDAFSFDWPKSNALFDIDEDVVWSHVHSPNGKDEELIKSDTLLTIYVQEQTNSIQSAVKKQSIKINTTKYSQLSSQYGFYFAPRQIHLESHPSGVPTPFRMRATFTLDDGQLKHVDSEVFYIQCKVCRM